MSQLRLAAGSTLPPPTTSRRIGSPFTRDNDAAHLRRPNASCRLNHDFTIGHHVVVRRSGTTALRQERSECCHFDLRSDTSGVVSQLLTQQRFRHIGSGLYPRGRSLDGDTTPDRWDSTFLVGMGHQFGTCTTTGSNTIRMVQGHDRRHDACREEEQRQKEQHICKRFDHSP